MNATDDDASDGQRNGKILVVDDDTSLAEMLKALLTSVGYDVWLASNAAEAKALVVHVHPDLILLDLMLPDEDGLVLYSELRDRWPAPVILLSATHRRADPIVGLRLGAEDFIAKPFGNQELLARIAAILRRTCPDTCRQAGNMTHRQHRINLGLLTLELPTWQAWYDDQQLRLTPLEFRLLATLASEPNRVFSRSELAQRVWGHESIGQSRLVDVKISVLRRYFERLGASDLSIATVRGSGYMLSGVRGT
jgi:DNA-binding response OmpR family regulator